MSSRFLRSAQGGLHRMRTNDEWTKEGLAIEVDGRLRSPRVIEVLSRLVSERGAPLYLRPVLALSRIATLSLESSANG